MGFRENLVEVVPGFLLDPQLKLWFQFGGGSGLEPNQTYLRIGYDPELDPDRVFVPPSEEDRRIWLMSPLTAHLADVPKVFRSKLYDEIEHLTVFWTEHEDRIQYKIDNDLTLFRLKAKIVENKHYPVISDDGRDTLLYAVRSASRIKSEKGDFFSSPKFAGVKSIEVWIHTDVLVDFFKLPLAEFSSPEPGWVILSSREIVR
jgi:hypothetical protein